MTVPGFPGFPMNIPEVLSETTTSLRQVLHYKRSWLLLPGFGAVALVYASHHLDLFTEWLRRDSLEVLALYLVPIIVVILAAKSIITRDSLAIFLAALAAVFFTRELHDSEIHVFGREFELETKGIVNLLLVGMALWGVFWHERLLKSLNRSIFLKVSLAGVLWTYLFSQLIARRAFKPLLPNEAELHIPLEETTETAAHLFFLAFALLFFFLHPGKKA